MKNNYIGRTLNASSLLFCAIVISVNLSCRGEEPFPESPYRISGRDTLYKYTNPVGNITNIGDPFILLHGGKYFLYATSSGEGFKVWESENMISWNEKGLALNKNYEGNNWGKGNFWAPEVIYHKGMFYMTYSAIGDNNLMKIRIARSNSPLGPFINWSEPFCNTDSYSYIDGSIMSDRGELYLFYVRDCSVNIIEGKHVSQIYVSKLSPDLKTLTGSQKLILTPDHEWEGIRNDWMWNEGPFVFKNNDKLILFYSANVYSSADYSVGIAIADSSLGNWSKYSGNPILKKDLSLNISGPGHCMITHSPDSSEFFVVYHTHTFFDKPSGNRNVCIDRLIFDNGIPKIIGPTRTPQPLPSGVKYWIKN